MSKFSSLFSAIGGLFGGDAPNAPAPPPPLPTRGDPEVAAARKREKLAARRRGGRASSILTSGRGVEEQLGTVSRPEATRASELLGA